MADQSEGAEPSDPMGDVLSSGDGSAAPASEDASESDSFTEVTTKSWLQRLLEAAIGVVVGLVFVLVTVIGLFWNKGRAVQTARSLAEGAGLVVEADPGRVD